MTVIAETDVDKIVGIFVAHGNNTSFLMKSVWMEKQLSYVKLPAVSLW